MKLAKVLTLVAVLVLGVSGVVCAQTYGSGDPIGIGGDVPSQQALTISVWRMTDDVTGTQVSSIAFGTLGWNSTWSRYEPVGYSHFKVSVGIACNAANGCTIAHSAGSMVGTTSGANIDDHVLVTFNSTEGGATENLIDDMAYADSNGYTMLYQPGSSASDFTSTEFLNVYYGLVAHDAAGNLPDPSYGTTPIDAMGADQPADSYVGATVTYTLTANP